MPDHIYSLRDFTPEDRTYVQVFTRWLLDTKGSGLLVLAAKPGGAYDADPLVSVMHKTRPERTGGWAGDSGAVARATTDMLRNMLLDFHQHNPQGALYAVTDALAMMTRLLDALVSGEADMMGSPGENVKR